jgi:hypothetical protein
MPPSLLGEQVRTLHSCTTSRGYASRAVPLCQSVSEDISAYRGGAIRQHNDLRRFVASYRITIHSIPS